MLQYNIAIMFISLRDIIDIGYGYHNRNYDAYTTKKSITFYGKYWQNWQTPVKLLYFKKY